MAKEGPQEESPSGYIVLAAYSPDPVLFRRQIESIQAQTVTDFRCIVTADGGAADVANLLSEIVGDDPRFSVIGHHDRVGFYSNFERGLASVPRTAAWVALADQDDYWYEDKLETLLPHLDHVALVSGQARVVRHPSGEVIADSTRRRNVPVEAYTLGNQFTGSQMLFRREVLDTALPFPHLSTAAEVHDHWIAVVAHFRSGSIIADDVVQDYVQHDKNVIGEAKHGFNPMSSINTALGLAKKYEGNTSARAVRDAAFKVTAGWRELIVTTLASRIPENADMTRLLRLFGPKRRSLPSTVVFLRLVRRGDVPFRALIEYLVGALAGRLGPVRRNFSRSVATSVANGGAPLSPSERSSRAPE